MGNITNLATTGNYIHEAGSLKVVFNFAIDNETTRLKAINGGSVIEDDKYVADFNMAEYLSENNRISYTITRGREAEVMDAITAAIASLEERIASGLINE